ncbi:EAL domain-containing protein [Nodosilinea sp. LEGE 06152]|uniref:two-component system response regulator n=1 Tax=Nodosilinea sp. LEGE 06152 TaxID=2777966 RepID=UPI00187E69A7|nr:EAL domain-containing protein [Nodosilinea sp. LEGE 06152]MBE9157659.1 EAL domain-containing protein [Nodosilinea sp. LEGE 06152]
MSTTCSLKPVILIVDDIPDNLHLLTRELSAQGYETRGVLTGTMALTVARSTPIDLILLDIMLPDMDGYTVCQTLKADPATEAIPVIFLSALDEALDKVKAFTVGGVDYVTKPFKTVEVMARVSTQLSLRQAQLQLQQFNQELENQVQQRTHELGTTNQSLQAEIQVRRQVEQDLRNSELRYRLIADHMGDLVCLHDPAGQFLYVSPSAQTLLGYAPEALVGKSLADFCHPDDMQYVQIYFQAPLESAQVMPLCYRFRRQSGRYLWLETLTKPVLDETGQITSTVTSSRDVTRRVKIEKQLRYDSLHDALTHLPNRDWLAKRLELEIMQCHRYSQTCFGLLMIDLDRFKAVNDSLGHLTGDKLLIAVSSLLKSCVRDVDMVSRWGGDEFVIFLDRITDLKEAIQVAERIKTVLESPIEVDGKIIFTSASIGILMGNNAYRTSNEIFRDVDIALHRAKALGRNRYEIFGLEMYQEAIALLNLENDLRLAIRQQDFITYYQPIISLSAQALLGFEALVRWQHPSRGLIMPGDFIDLAEDTGLIKAVGIQVLRQVCETIKQWENDYSLDPHFRISVNVSGQQFRDANFIATLDQILAETGVRGDRLKLEITERVLLEQSGSIAQTLAEITARGMQLSIDDFGTGYSSLRYLSQFAVQTLKIDRSFIHQMQPRRQGIVQAIVDLAHNLEMDCIAEGVETEEQRSQLLQLGCEAAQGYLFSRPLPLAAASETLQRWLYPKGERGLA